MKKKNIMKKAAALFMAATMALSPVMSTLPVYASSSQTATYAEETDDYVVLDDDQEPAEAETDEKSSVEESSDETVAQQNPADQSSTVVTDETAGDDDSSNNDASSNVSSEMLDRIKAAVKVTGDDYYKVDYNEVASFKKTFSVGTAGGTLTILKKDGTVLAVLNHGDSYELDYHEGTDAPDEVIVYAKADDGYLVSSYTGQVTDEGVTMDMDDPEYDIFAGDYIRGHYLVSDNADEAFCVSFVKKGDAKPSVQNGEEDAEIELLSDTDDIDWNKVKVGQVFKGSAKISYHRAKTKTYNGTGKIKMTSGTLSGNWFKMKKCASGSDHWAPTNGMKGSYTFTVKSIDLQAGKVGYRIKWVPSGDNKKAYQTLSTSATFSIPKQGEFEIQKQANLSEENGNVMIPDSIKLSATFGIFTDAACTNKVREVVTDDTGYVKVSDLAVGTYWVKELEPPKGLKPDPTPQQVKTGSSATMLVFEDEYWTTSMKLYKKARGANPNDNIPSMAGAVYKLYTDADCKTEATTDVVLGTGSVDPGQSDTVDRPIVAFVPAEARPEEGNSYALKWGYLDQSGNLIEYNIAFAVGTKFWFKEVQAPSNGNYELDNTVHVLDLTTKEVYEAASKGSGALENLIKTEYSTMYEDIAVGYLKVHKDTDVDVKDVFDLSGAVYGVYSDEQCKTLVESLTTDANGDTKVVELKCSTYYVKEIQAPEGYALDTKVYTAKVTGANTVNVPVTINSNDTLLHKEFSINKIAANMDGNVPALSDAEFTVKYFGKDKERVDVKKTWVIKTAAETKDDKAVYVARFDDSHKVAGDAFYKNKSGAVVLPLGYYSIEETKAPENYATDGATFDSKPIEDAKNFSIELVEGTVQIVNSFETVENEAVVADQANGGIILNKVDNETGKQYPLGAANFKGFTFGIYNASGKTITINGTSYDNGAEIERITTDENGIAKTGEFDLLTNGTTYLVKELSGNGTYLVGGSMEITLTKGGYTQAPNGVAYKNQVVRGDFSFSKKDFKTQKPMAGVQFKITSVTTGESHVVSTDANGYYNSSAAYAPHTENTNSGEPGAGTWFGIDKEGNVAEVNDSLGAFPYDTYTVEEIAGEDNKNKVLVSFTVTVNKNNFTVDLGTINNFDEAKATISTVAIDKETKSHVGTAATKSTILERVSYENLKEGKEYKLVTTLMNKDTGATFMDKNGEPVILNHKFTPSESNGYVNIDINFDSILLNGGTVVVFEKLYDGDELVAQHEDIESEDQSVSYPSLSIKTTALDVDTNDHLGTTTENATLRDTISYEDLKGGTKYTMVTSLMRLSTGENLTDKDGKPVIVTNEFTPKDTKGSVYVDVKFDATQLGGDGVVVFEELYDGDELIASHKDMEDADQTVYYPTLKTEAKDTVTGSNMVLASDKISITDTVHLKGVMPNKKVTVKGTLLDKSTGKAVLDKNGKEVTASVDVNPESSECDVDVVFEFDGSNLVQGVVIVAEEQLEYKGTVYCVHSDLEDQDQTVYVPGIQTEAICDDTGLHVMYAGKEVTIVDTVSYKGLLTNDMMNGDSYRMDGTVMDADTGKTIQTKNENGELEDVKSSLEFTTAESNGSVEVRFNFDTKDLETKNYVVFEKLYRVNTETGEETLIASHEDLTDENQTVHTPEIKTTLTNKESGTHHAKAVTEVTLVDTIAYSGLIPEKTYKLNGVLKDQATGDSITLDGKEVTAEATFTPEKESGEVEVEFTLNASTLSGKTVVAFEKLTYQDKEIAAHEDINDGGQSVAFPEIHTTATDSTKTNHTVMASSKAVIIDTISYKGLIPGVEYTAYGYLVDPENGNALKAGLFSKVEAKTVFTPDKADGEVDVAFEFDASDLGGKTVVVFEEITYADEKDPVAEHKDTTDTNQMVSIPEIKTSATNENKKLHIVKADENAVVVDTVTYKGLEKDGAYVMKAEIMDPESGEGINATAAQEFTAKATEGSVDVKIELDTTKYAGKSLVVFETLSTKGTDESSTIIAEHRDLKDSEQTFYIPKVETKASDGKDGDQKLKAEKSATIVDKVTMDGLEAGREVKLVGTVMDKESGKVLAIDSKEVTAETTFKAKAGSFDQELKFEFDASGLKKGAELVVFEKLYDVETGEEIGSHEDLESESQTVTISEKKGSSDDSKDGSDKSSKGVSTSDAVGFIAVFLILGVGAVTAGIVIRKRRCR